MPAYKGEHRRTQKRRKGSLVYWGSETSEPPDKIEVPEAFRILKVQEEPALKAEHATQESNDS